MTEEIFGRKKEDHKQSYSFFSQKIRNIPHIKFEMMLCAINSFNRNVREIMFNGKGKKENKIITNHSS